MELIAYIALTVTALLFFRSSYFKRYPWPLALCVLTLSLIGGTTWGMLNRSRSQAQARLKEALPGKREDDFVSSDTCKACHPSQYDSWHASYHRTMTQVATPNSVVGDFNKQRLWTWSHWYDLERRGDEFWVKTDDPDWEYRKPDSEGKPREIFEKQIAMTTGSHNYQVYWAKNQDGLEHFHLPFVYLIKEQRWVPREFVFVNPPETRLRSFWNGNCLLCHTTGGISGFNFEGDVAERNVQSKVAEFGISCEACHGPAQGHITANKNPLRRYFYHFTKKPDPTIVNPTRLSAKAGSQVCGQCHGVTFALDLKDMGFNGNRFRPGDDLEKVRVIANLNNYNHPSIVTAMRDAASLDYFTKNYFWPDGVVRVSGREYNSMPMSKCSDGGKLTCFSCHSMHKSDPNQQLAAGMDGNEACLQCHEPIRNKIKEHTHHDPAGEGSNCYNCHMPYTVYGLLKGERSHFIERPSVANTMKTGRPNGCNLCHLDKTLAWTDQHLHDWYGTPQTPDLSEDQKRIAASILWALSGDANQRALMAFNMGWGPAFASSGGTWMVPYLAQLLVDPYPAIRFVAERSLRGIEGYADINYNFMGSNQEMYESRTSVMEQWKAARSTASRATGTVLLIEPSGELNQDLYARLMENRDNSPRTLME